MKNSLNLKTYDIPESFSAEAQFFCEGLVKDIDKTHKFYKNQIEYLKQQFQIIMRQARPTTISIDSLALLFDEVELDSDSEDEPEVEDTEKRQKKKKRKKKLKAIPDHLPRTIVKHDLTEEDKKCEKHGTALNSIGFDIKEELKFTPAKYEVIEHHYPKYVCPCCAEGVKRSPPMPSIIPASYASNELLAHIAVSKYCNHLPLYRQEQMLAREGINITRQVMSQWMIKLGEALNPLIGIMHDKILDSDVIHADETPVKLLTKAGIRTSKLSYMWQISRWGPKPLVMFEYDPTRKKEVAVRLLGSFAGYIQVDGYAGYNNLFAEGSPRIRVGCMAHVFRKFKDFLVTLPKEKRRDHPVKKIMSLIDQLYKIEEPLKSVSSDERYLARKNSEADSLMEELQDLVAFEKNDIASDSPYYKALKYAQDELSFISNYLQNGKIEIDNNFAENAIRPFALGRRNWLFICAERGAQASANIYSILTTAKANKIEPYSYLLKVISNLPKCESLEDFEALLPA